MFQYDVDTLSKAISDCTQEVLPGSELYNEVERLVHAANSSGEQIKHYIGFEISGQIHIGTGISSALKIKELTDAGVHCIIWLANYHTIINEKLDGQADTIDTVARTYFAPVMKQCCELVGCNMDLVEVKYSTDTYDQDMRNDHNFWWFDLKIGQKLTLKRILKSISITGKDAGDDVKFALLRYPALQVADAFFMNAHLVHAGMDQRKCHVLMREVADKIDEDLRIRCGDLDFKPIAIHHDLLHGLLPPSGEEGIAKMSKSKPDSAVWVHESAEEIKRKLKKAYCPAVATNNTQEEEIAIQAQNPILNWSERIIYRAGRTIELKRPEKFGGDKHYQTFNDLFSDYLAGHIHPMDLKNSVAEELITWFSPVRDWLSNEQPEGYQILIELGK